MWLLKMLQYTIGGFFQRLQSYLTGPVVLFFGFLLLAWYLSALLRPDSRAPSDTTVFSLQPLLLAKYE